MSTPPPDPRDGLYALGRELLGDRPTIITSAHTMEEMFASLRDQTKVVATGYSAPRATLDHWNDIPTTSGDGKSLEQSATITVVEAKHEFVVHRIDAVDRRRGGLTPDFVIYGIMDHEEPGNYYGTNRWTTKTRLVYKSADDRFEFLWDMEPTR